MGSRFTVKQSMRVRPWLGLQNFHWYTFPLIYSFLLAQKQLRVQRLVQHPAKFSYLTRFTLSNSNPLKTKSGWGNQISKWYQGHCIIKGVLSDVHLMISCYLCIQQRICFCQVRCIKNMTSIKIWPRFEPDLYEIISN